MLGNKLLNIQFVKYHIWNNKSEGFPNMVLSTETFNQSVRTEYSEPVNARYTIQPLWVSDPTSGLVWPCVRSDAYTGFSNLVRFSLKVKGMVYWSCVRVAMLHGSETWCLWENEIAILRRTERAMVRAMCGAKLMEKKDRGPDEDVGIERNSGSDGKGKWSEMVRACVEEK